MCQWHLIRDPSAPPGPLGTRKFQTKDCLDHEDDKEECSWNIIESPEPIRVHRGHDKVCHKYLENLVASHKKSSQGADSDGRSPRVPIEHIKKIVQNVKDKP